MIIMKRRVYGSSGLAADRAGSPVMGVRGAFLGLLHCL